MDTQQQIFEVGERVRVSMELAQNPHSNVGTTDNMVRLAGYEVTIVSRRGDEFEAGSLIYTIQGHQEGFESWMLESLRPKIKKMPLKDFKLIFTCKGTVTIKATDRNAAIKLALTALQQGGTVCLMAQDTAKDYQETIEVK